jgi:hypothetical protein
VGALLKIVQPPAVVAQESACRVLNAGLVDRLGAMNAAVRTLRDMGYRVVAQTLFPVRGGKPEVLIDRDRRGVHRPAAGPLARSPVANRGRQARLHRVPGVTVTWEEA